MVVTLTGLRREVEDGTAGQPPRLETPVSVEGRAWAARTTAAAPGAMPDSESSRAAVLRRIKALSGTSAGISIA